MFTATLYYMEGVRLRGARYDAKTRWPAGFDDGSSGAVLSESAPAQQPGGTGASTVPPTVAPPAAVPPLPLPRTAPPRPATVPPLPLPAPAVAPQRTPIRVVRKAPKLDGETLTEDVIKWLLETEMWAGKDLRRFSFDYASLKMVPPRQGTNLTDIATGKPRIVTPVRVEVKMTKSYDNNETATTEFKQEYEFYRDEFGTWTYKFQRNLN